MVDEEITKIAHDRIRIEIGEQDNNLHREIDRAEQAFCLPYQAYGSYCLGSRETRLPGR